MVHNTTQVFIRMFRPKTEAKGGVKTLRTRNNNSTMRNRTTRTKSTRKSQRLTLRQQDEQVKCFGALNRVRRGDAKTISEAARAEGTTLRAIRELVPKAITQKRPGSRIRVTPTDRYSATVQIMIDEGAVTATARGSRQRDLAGQHRATCIRVLRRLEPKSALEQYRGKKVGGHELVSNYEQLVMLAKAGVVGQLETLYVSPDVVA